MTVRAYVLAVLLLLRTAGNTQLSAALGDRVAESALPDAEVIPLEPAAQSALVSGTFPTYSNLLHGNVRTP